MRAISEWSRSAVGLLVLGVLVLVPVRAAQITQGDRSFTIRTSRLMATVADGMVVGLRNLKTGEVHADESARDVALPVGIGHLTGVAEEAAKLHMPWGTRTMNQEIKAGGNLPTMHRPHGGSRYATTPIPNGLKATWTGLTNGLEQFPDEVLEVAVWEDAETGRLCFRAIGRSPAAGVYGVQVPVANLHRDHAFYVPSFGGVMYDSDMSPGLTTLGGSPFWEAPVIGVEGRTGSLAVWTQDAQFHPNFCFLNWSGKTFSLAIEHLNLMPFEPHTGVESVTWYLDVFDGGWVDAMTPYRNWYAHLFAKEIAARSAVSWADRIRVVIDHWDKGDPAHLRKLAALFEPDTVLFQEWNARAPKFDQELPDWTPKAGYVERVKAIHSFGFRTMAYVNTYCVNYNSPVFKRDNIQEFGLTRRYRGFSRYLREPQTFSNTKDGKLLYLDPLSPRWRAYHTDMMIQWYKETGTDANYEDVGGTTGDFGNGVIEGKFGAQGGVEQFRELLARNPAVPMASEYAPNPIAFAVRWPLRFQQVWGGNTTRTFWMQHQRPVSAYIHGPLHLAWVPTIRAESNFLRHVVVACSDALGGLAQMPGDARSLAANQGILVHMKWRAQVFSRKQLKPTFTAERLAPGIACQYEDRDGRIYTYHTSKTVQRMVGPDGRGVYARVTGLNRFETDLNLPGWPAVGEKAIAGLDPKVRYALVPGVPDATAVRVTALPDGVKVSRYYETKEFALLVLSPLDASAVASGQVSLRLTERFRSASLNDAVIELPKGDDDKPAAGELASDTAFPARFVFLKAAGQALKHGQYAGDGHKLGRYIIVASGLDRGSEYVPKYRASFKIPDETASVPFTFVSYGSDAEVVMDYVVRVPAKDSSLRVFQKNRSNKYGNASIGKLYINGRLTRAYDFGPKPNPEWKEGMPKAKKSIWDTMFHSWTVPMGHLAGQAVVVSVATDAKASNNADNHWWSRPKFVSDPEQAARSVVLSDAEPVPEDDGRCVGR